MRHQVRSALRLLRLKEDFLAAPDFLEVVVVADIGLEHVNHHSAQIDEDPFARIAALNAEDFAARFLHSARDRVGKRTRLAVRGTRSDDDALKLVGQLFRIKNLDVARFDVFKRFNGGGDKFVEFHKFCF